MTLGRVVVSRPRHPSARRRSASRSPRGSLQRRLKLSVRAVAGGEAALARWARNASARVIVLDRDELARRVSNVRKGLTRRYECPDAACAAAARAALARVPAGDLVARLRADAAEWTAVRAWARRVDARASPLEVAYRDLAADPDATAARAFSFLRAGAAAVAANLTVKMGPPTAREGLANADEVAAALAGTRWAASLDEPFA